MIVGQHLISFMSFKNYPKIIMTAQIDRKHNQSKSQSVIAQRILVTSNQYVHQSTSSSNFIQYLILCNTKTNVYTVCMLYCCPTLISTSNYHYTKPNFQSWLSEEALPCTSIVEGCEKKASSMTFFFKYLRRNSIQYWKGIL